MGVSVEIEVTEIRNRFVSAGGSDFAGSHETPEALHNLDVNEVRNVKLVVIPKEAGLHACAKRGLQEKLHQGRRVDDDHADSRSSRTTTAAGVFSVTRFRPWSLASISSRVGRTARRSISAKR